MILLTERENSMNDNWGRVSVVSVCFGLLLGAALGMCSGCQSTKNITNIYVQEGSTATITADGGSNAKPITLRDLTATVPAM